MTYQAHNKPKSDSNELYVFVTTCLQIIRIYVQSVHNGLDVIQRHHLGEGRLEGSTDPQGFMILVFSL